MTLTTALHNKILACGFLMAVPATLLLMTSTEALAQSNTLSFVPPAPGAGQPITVTVTRVPGNCLSGGSYASAVSGGVLTIAHSFTTQPPPPQPVGVCTETVNVGSLSAGTYQVIWEERFLFTPASTNLVASGTLDVAGARSVPLTVTRLLAVLVALTALALSYRARAVWSAK
jgi:hypothetical protein